MKHLHTPKVFLKELVQRIQQAKNMVLIQAMYFEHDSSTESLIKALVHAAKRGTRVCVNIDWVTTKYIKGNMTLLPLDTEHTRLKQKNEKMFTDLVFSGVEVTILNKPNFIKRLFPFFGRNHSKLFIVDDIAWIGGINLGQFSFKSEDFVIKLTKRSLVRTMKQIFFRLKKNNISQDTSTFPEKQYKMLIDRGMRNQSIIYDNALRLVCNAKKNVTIVSQILPDGCLLSKLLLLPPEVKITIITSSKDNMFFSHYPLKLLYLLFLWKIKKNENIKLVHLDRFVHAKLLLVDNKYALFGSHNLVWMSVLLGTRELSLYTDHRQIVAELVHYVRDLKK